MLGESPHSWSSALKFRRQPMSWTRYDDIGQEIVHAKLRERCCSVLSFTVDKHCSSARAVAPFDLNGKLLCVTGSRVDRFPQLSVRRRSSPADVAAARALALGPRKRHGGARGASTCLGRPRRELRHRARGRSADGGSDHLGGGGHRHESREVLRDLGTSAGLRQRAALRAAIIPTVLAAGRYLTPAHQLRRYLL